MSRVRSVVSEARTAETSGDTQSTDGSQATTDPGGELQRNQRADAETAAQTFPLGMTDPGERLGVIGIVAIACGIVYRIGGEFWGGWHNTDATYLRLISYGTIVAGAGVAIGSAVVAPTIRLLHALELVGGAVWTLGAIYGLAWLLKLDMAGAIPSTPGRYPLAVNLAGVAILAAAACLGSIVGILSVVTTLCFGLVAGLTYVLETTWRRI